MRRRTTIFTEWSTTGYSSMFMPPRSAPNRWPRTRAARPGMRQGDWDEVLRSSERLRRTAPDDWRGWFASAEALSALGNNAEALSRHEAAVERFPDEFWPNFGLARVTARHSCAEDTVRIWSDLVSRFPGKLPALEALDSARLAAETRPAEIAASANTR